MFQTFGNTNERHLSAGRVALLRGELKRRGLDGLIVPRQDEFQGESVAPYAERLRWLTGFAGSWGLAILMQDRGAIFVDGRYTIQVREQVDEQIFAPRHLVEQPPVKWLETELKKGERLGYDPWLLTADQVQKFQAACDKAGASLVVTTPNPIDTVWPDQPPRPRAEVFSQPIQFAGRTSADKLKEIAAVLKDIGADAVLLTQPESPAWLLNIRGSDVAHTPVVLAYAAVRTDASAILFVDEARVPEDVRSNLGSAVTLKPPEAIEPELARLGEQKLRVQIDSDHCPEKARAILSASGAILVSGRDPCALPRARKNGVEQEGARAAHRRDGVAMCRFLRWLAEAGPLGRETEISAAVKLAAFRGDGGQLRDLSFDTISASGPHAAIPHYRVSEATSRPLREGEMYLIDSGAQYQDGTTDITRTVMMGPPTAEMRDRFTRVLKGMIAISTLRFPKGTSGSQIDALARQHLWAAGLDFDHGTGHGVGSYLSVHEGPARINKTDRTGLEPGMILSNEPGYYKAGAYGIRIENLLLVREAEPVEGGERPMLWFETLTLCPIDRSLIEEQLLTRSDLCWLDAYHARVLREIGPMLDGDDLAWLETACAPLSRLSS
jgi:Xaa-Pro aminopeptidase